MMLNHIKAPSDCSLSFCQQLPQYRTVEVRKPWCADLELQDFQYLKFLQIIDRRDSSSSFKPWKFTVVFPLTGREKKEKQPVLNLTLLQRRSWKLDSSLNQLNVTTSIISFTCSWSLSPSPLDVSLELLCRFLWVDLTLKEDNLVFSGLSSLTAPFCLTLLLDFLSFGESTSSSDCSLSSVWVFLLRDLSWRLDFFSFFSFW